MSAPERFDPKAEKVARDAALERFEGHTLTQIAKVLASEIAACEGTVTGPQVAAELRRLGIYDSNDPADPRDARFMGAVFRRGWVQVGTSRTGSHNRTVPIWRPA